MTDTTRRSLLGAAGAATLAAVASRSAFAQAAGARVRIIAVSCSPRKGKTTAAALTVCLEAARSVSDRIDTELIELAGLRIAGEAAGATALGDADDFPAIAARLADPAVGGIIVGSPVYFSGISALCKVFLDRAGTLRAANFSLRGKVGGALAVGGVRNGGQELAVQNIQAALFCQDMLIVGDGRPTAHTGATLLNDGKDDISGDTFGLATARGLGRRVAEVALLMNRQ